MANPHVSDRSCDSKNFSHTSGLGDRHDKHQPDEKKKPIKGITTENNAFVEGAQTVAKLFYEFPYIVSVLETEKIHFISQVHSDFNLLIKIKGIGRKSAARIMEVLNG